MHWIFFAKLCKHLLDKNFSSIARIIRSPEVLFFVLTLSHGPGADSLGLSTGDYNLSGPIRTCSDAGPVQSEPLVQLFPPAPVQSRPLAQQRLPLCLRQLSHTPIRYGKTPLALPRGQTAWHAERETHHIRCGTSYSAGCGSTPPPSSQKGFPVSGLSTTVRNSCFLPQVDRVYSPLSQHRLPPPFHLPGSATIDRWLAQGGLLALPVDRPDGSSTLPLQACCQL